MTTRSKSKLCPWCAAPISASAKICPKCTATVVSAPNLDVPGLTRLSDGLAAEAAILDAKLAERHVPRLVSRLLGD
jgi:predicted amidophosphoribosyltransferase